MTNTHTSGTEAAKITQLEAAVQLLNSHPDYQVLCRFSPKSHYHSDGPLKLQRAAIIDTESTGVDPHVDKIVELGMVKVEFCPETGRVYNICGSFNQLEDPGTPIPAAASLVNGISDEMVAGKKIDDDDVADFIADVDVFIAHNAGFDRVILERRFPLFANKAFACSQRQVDWAAEGIGTQKLDYIAYKLGFFYVAHRAEADCMALLEVLQRPLPVSAELALKQLIDNSVTPGRRIWALDARYEMKDILKRNGYHWGDGTNGSEKAWHKEVSQEDYDAEIAWLRANVYFNRKFRVAVDSVDSLCRFSGRRGQCELVMVD